MPLNPSNSSNLEQLALKGFDIVVNYARICVTKRLCWISCMHNVYLSVYTRRPVSILLLAVFIADVGYLTQLLHVML